MKKSNYGETYRIKFYYAVLTGGDDCIGDLLVHAYSFEEAKTKLEKQLLELYGKIVVTSMEIDKGTW